MLQNVVLVDKIEIISIDAPTFWDAMLIVLHAHKVPVLGFPNGQLRMDSNYDWKVKYDNSTEQYRFQWHLRGIEGTQETDKIIGEIPWLAEAVSGRSGELSITGDSSITQDHRVLALGSGSSREGI